MMYRVGPDFSSYSRRGNWRIVDYATVAATRKTDEKTRKMVLHLTENHLNTTGFFKVSHTIEFFRFAIADFRKGIFEFSFA